MMNVSEKLKELVMGNVKFSDEAKELNDNTNLTTDLYIDSVGLIKLFTEIEIEFDIEIEYEAMTERDLMILGELEKYIVEKMENK